MPSGSRIFRLRSNRTSKHRSEITITIGNYPELEPELAREVALTHLVEIAKGNNPNEKSLDRKRKGVVLLRVFKDYKAHNTHLKDRTAQRYEAVLNRNLHDWINKPLGDISREKISNRHRELTERSPSEADNTFRVLRALFNFAKEEYRGQESEIFFDENPVEILKHRKQWNNVKCKTTHVKKSDLPKWWRVIFKEWEQARAAREVYRASVCCSLLVALLTGLRKNEILSLEWHHVDFNNDALSVNDTKNGDSLELPISPLLKSILLTQKAFTCEKYAFPSPGFGRVKEPKKVIADLNKLVGFAIGYHDLRRTFATIAEGAVVGGYALKRLLNHRTSRSDVTAGYTILTAEELREPSAKIEQRIIEIAQVGDH
ncbi:Integrase [Vibrio crassostreae]|nr:Integrase [Vibrio crassostreae]